MRSSDVDLPIQNRRSSECDSLNAIGPNEVFPAELQSKIHRSSDCDSFDSTYTAVHLPASSRVPRFASLYKSRCPSLNFESTDKGIDHGLKDKVGVSDSQGGDATVIYSETIANTPDPTSVNETLGRDVNARGTGKAMNRHPNSIAGCVIPTAQVSKPKPVNEGNFVRLNINGHGGRKKYANKVRKRNPNAYTGSRKSYKRIKRKQKGGGEGEEEQSFCEEEGFPLEKDEGTEVRLDLEVIELAVLNFDMLHLRLLKLTHGYDSFRHGQLATIRFILSGKSSMVILPTGAGKSLCYQLPTMVLQGMTNDNTASINCVTWSPDGTLFGNSIIFLFII